MSFLHPELLWGLLALAVPIIVHFFYLRRSRRYEFSQVVLVERLRRASKPYLRLRHLFLLLLRLAIVGVIVLLFARPYWGAATASQAEGASVLVVVDVSPSMRPGFESALTFLKEVISRDPPNYEYRLLSTESYLPKGGFASRQVVIERLNQLQPADMGFPLASLLEKVELFFQGASYARRKVYLLSDFQRGSVGQLERIPTTGLEQIVLLPVPGFSPSNAYFDSVEVSSMGGGYRVRYRLVSREARTYSVSVAEQKRSLLPGWYEEIFSPKESPAYLSLSIQGDGVDFDNALYVGVAALRSALQGVSWQGPEAARAAFEKLHRVLGISPRSEKEPIAWESVLVLVASLERLPEGALTWVAQGGRAVLFPPAVLSPTSWNRSPLAERISYGGEIAVKPPLLSLEPVEAAFWEGVFLRSGRSPAFLMEPLPLDRLYRFQPQAARILLQDDKGNPLLWEIAWGRGYIYLFAFPWTAALGQHSLFVPLFSRLYQGGQVGADAWLVRLGQRKSFSLPFSGAGGPVLRHLATGAEYIPPFERRGSELLFSAGDQPIPAGLYEVLLDGKRASYLGVSPAVEESQADFLDPEVWQAAGIPVEVRTWTEGTVEARKVGGVWRSWWSWLFLALALLAAETYWARQLLKPTTVPVP